MIHEANVALVAMATVLAVVSPGPDFAVTVRNTLAHGRGAGLATALGIAVGVGVHVTYTLLGLGYVVAAHPWVLSAVRWVGGSYLVWLGASAFVSRRGGKVVGRGEDGEDALGMMWGFRKGMLCNVLNPKTVLFFLALFTQVVEPGTSVGVQAGIGVFAVAAHLVWFSFVAVMLTGARGMAWFGRCGGVLERGAGVCLFGLGGKLLVGG